ncbi:hypothetical protein MF406_14390 [Georgenia sp. TF02-10]|uniref:hypothetical protein n=1 Tax=Georgenia sp. TF02-10 TaxID=2917725 RepID=UPI001FA70EC3|nr:hypothetical protein [Georgenia sp. TF02-10]UNX54121.1 hypothetical protein MF406_14390 [Georgenia sp. TF02-10]
MSPRHRTTDVHSPNGPVARALARAAGARPVPSGRRAADPPAVLGLADDAEVYHLIPDVARTDRDLKVVPDEDGRHVHLVAHTPKKYVGLVVAREDLLDALGVAR